MITDSISTKRDLPKWFWVGLPLSVLVIQLGIGLSGRVDLIRSEFGLIENLTLLVLFAAILLGLRLVFGQRAISGKLFVAWALLLTLGAFYFAGEEASWGYHLLGWEVMGELKEINDQHEPNLHNLSGFVGTLLDQLPRLLLTVAAVVGGILVPLWHRFVRPISWPTGWIWPTVVCLPVAVLAVGVTVPSKVLGLLDVNVRIAGQGENKELFLAMFIMMYLASLTYRVAVKASSVQIQESKPMLRTGPGEFAELPTATKGQVPGGAVADGSRKKAA